MKIAVIDGLGGGIGAQLVTRLKQELGDSAEIIALGANAVATDRMVRAGADRGASGENAVRVTIVTVDFVVAPIGVVIPDSMMGEITSGIASSVISSSAEKVLLPLSHQHFTIVGYEQAPVAGLIAQAVDTVKARIEREAVE